MHSPGLTGGGLVIGGGNKVKFKKNENAKKEKFKEEKIKKVIFIITKEEQRLNLGCFL